MLRIPAGQPRRARRLSSRLGVEVLEDRTVLSATQAYLEVPLSFEANVGQTDEQVQFLARGQGYSLFLTPGEAVLSLSPTAEQSAVVRAKIVGANLDSQPIGLEEQEGKSNYFVGSDPSQWHSDVTRYSRVEYPEIYPGIDLVYYGTGQQELEYDFVVSPGANPNVVQMSYQGVQSAHLNASGELILHTSVGDIVKHAPVIYQDIGGIRRFVSGSFTLDTSNGVCVVGFDIDAYDTTIPLVIDPVLSYSTYLGGSGLDSALDLVVDSAGSVYVTGRTSSANFPLAGAIDSTTNGPTDAFVMKLDPTGSTLVYSTFLGGSGSENHWASTANKSINVDATGNVFVTGYTTSADFPTVAPIQASLRGSQDAFLCKLDPTGSTLLYSSFLGGTGQDYGDGVTLDSSGNTYWVGHTVSNDFPVTAGSYQTTTNGNEGFITKLDPSGSTMIFSTYLGGLAFSDIVSCVELDASNNIVVGGYTFSSNYPTTGGLDSTLGGGTDVVLTKLNAAGTALIFSTYIGGSGGDGLAGISQTDIAIGPTGDIYITSCTSSADFPVTAGAFDTTYNGGTDAFVMRVDGNTGATIYSTYLGGTGQDFGFGIEVNTAGEAIVTGYTQSANFPTLNPMQAALGGTRDAFVTVLNATGTALVYSTFFGGAGNEYGNAIELDPQGQVYLAGQTDSANYPTLTPIQGTAGGAGDAFVAKINMSGVSITPSGGTTTIAEGGATDDYAVVLTALPTADVVVTLTPDAQVSVSATTLTFTTANWNIPQGVTVTATDDGTFEGAHSGIITHSATSVDSFFNGVQIASLTAAITDNDSAAAVTLTQTGGSTSVAEGGATDTYTVVLTSAPTADVFLTLAPDSQVTVAPTTLTFTPLNWNTGQTVVVSAVDDFVFEVLPTGTITHSISSADAAYNALTIPALTANITDNDLAGILSVNFVNVTEGGTTAVYPITLSSQPTANVTVTINPGTQVAVSTPTLMFTAANWNVAQNVTVTAVNDLLAEGAHSGIVTNVSSSTDPNYNGVTASVTANITDNDTAAITITQTGGTTSVAEGGATDTYLVVLATQPTANVIVTVSPTASLTVAPAVLTFTSVNWNVAQVVTVAAVDDAIFQGPRTGVITHSSTSADPLYNAITIAAVTASIAHNDATPGVSITQPASVQEGATTTYTIVLQTAPAANVVINLTPDAQVNVAPTSLVFTTANWSVPQTVSVSTIDDTLPEINQTGVITHTIASADAAYNALTVPAVTAYIVDNDGTLVLGTERDDRILVNFVGGKAQAIVNGKASWLPGPITQILVLAQQGNDFVQITAPTVPVVVLGGIGNDAVWVVGSAGYNTFILDSTSVTLNNRTVSIGEAESFVLGGRTSNDTFRIQNLPIIPTELKGDRGNDNVLAPDTDNDWHITSASGGTFNGSLTINGIENWYGGMGDDTFTFADKKTVAGKIDGGGGNDTLDYGAYTTPVAVNLQTRVATGTKTIANIASIRGGLASDKLIGPDQSNAWSLFDNNRGDVNGILFESFENLTGGKLDDMFSMADGIGVTGKIDGGAGADVLDYSGYSTAIAIHLQAKTATATGGMANFEQFMGGSDVDTLTGTNTVNKWTFTATGTGTLNKLGFSDFENFTGGASSDTFAVAASLAEWLGVLNGGAGKDSLFAFTTGVNLWTNGAVGAGTLNGRAFAGIELRR